MNKTTITKAYNEIHDILPLINSEVELQFSSTNIEKAYFRKLFINKQYSKLLYYFATENKFNEFVWLMKKVSNIDVNYSISNLPILIFSIYHCNYEAIKMLLEHGAIITDKCYYYCHFHCGLLDDNKNIKHTNAKKIIALIDMCYRLQQ
jgi:ankyrin repeat protein